MCSISTVPHLELINALYPFPRPGHPREARTFVSRCMTLRSPKSDPYPTGRILQLRTYGRAIANGEGKEGDTSIVGDELQMCKRFFALSRPRAMVHGTI